MYHILENHPPRTHLFSSISGVLVNSNGEIMPNPLGQGQKIVGLTSLEVHFEPSNKTIGKEGDRLFISVSNNSPIFAVSARLKEFLKEKIPGQAQFLKLNFNNELQHNYWAVNVLNRVDCIDHFESSLIYLGEGYDRVFEIKELILKKESIPPQIDVFLLGEVEDYIVVVSDTLKNELAEHGFSGFLFCRPEELRI